MTLQDLLKSDRAGKEAMFNLLQGFVKKGQKAQVAVDKIIKEAKKEK